MHVPCSCPRTWRRRPAPLTLVRSWNVGKWWHKCLRPLSAEHLLGSACLVWSCIVSSRLLRAVSLEHLTLSLSLTRAAIGVGLSQQSSMGLLSRVPLFTAPRLVHSFSPHISVSAAVRGPRRTGSAVTHPSTWCCFVACTSVWLDLLGSAFVDHNADSTEWDHKVVLKILPWGCHWVVSGPTAFCHNWLAYSGCVCSCS